VHEPPDVARVAAFVASHDRNALNLLALTAPYDTSRTRRGFNQGRTVPDESGPAQLAMTNNLRQLSQRRRPGLRGRSRRESPDRLPRTPRSGPTGQDCAVLAAPAAAKMWSGWVDIAQKTRFGLVAPLPGIWPSLHLDTVITPSRSRSASRRTRRTPYGPGWRKIR